MATIRKFEDLEIWQLSRELCHLIYTFIIQSNFSKDFKLVGQINGSSGSVMDNIADGFDRGSRKEFIQFPGIAKASCGEVKSQLYRALDRKYIANEEFSEGYKLADTINSKIYHFIDYLNTSSIKRSKYKGRMEEPAGIYLTLNLPFD